MLRIRDVFWIPDPGLKKFMIPDSRKNLSTFNPKNCFKALGNMIRDVHPGSGSWIFFLPNPDPDPVPF